MLYIMKVIRLHKLDFGVAHVKYFVVGDVSKDFIDKVLSIIKKFLEIVDSIDYLEVYIYGFTEYKLSFLESEALELGVMVVGDFVAMHEAWRGWPRIHVDYEKCSSISDEYLEAVIVHEVSHAILHGSPVYYSIAITVEKLPELNYEELAKAIYVATTVVKDIDVHEFLTRVSMVNIVKNYMEFSIKQLSELNCRNIDEVLQLAKTLAPCIFVNRCEVIRNIVPNSCRNTIDKILNILNRFKNIKTGDLSLDTVVLINELAPLLEEKEL